MIYAALLTLSPSPPHLSQHSSPSPPALLTLSPTLDFDCSQCLQSCGWQSQCTPRICVERQYQVLPVICILEEGAFHLEVRRERRVYAWPTCFWTLVTVSLLVESSELARPGMVFCSGQIGVTSLLSESPRILRRCVLRRLFPVGTGVEEAVLLDSAGWRQALGNRGPRGCQRESITAAPQPKALLTRGPGPRSSLGPVSVWPPGGQIPSNL